ncbi:MAG: DNA polymerase III subunit [Gammaproteobacteria bacterium]|nr:DNA polymerase III subunit [Gammaproteobacteria bacterium]
MTTVLPLTTKLPWLEDSQSALERSLTSDRLSHAVILQLSPGLGGHWLAMWLAARIFCTSSEAPQPCGACIACRRICTGEQPDYFLLQPSDDSKDIKIDQVRDLIRDLSLTSHGGGRKVVIISPADKLNRNAANALLKTLEEPPPGSLLLLVTGEPSRLPITLQSRCTRLIVRKPTITSLVDWLRSQKSGDVDWRAVLEVLGCNPLDALEADAVAITGLKRETQHALDRASTGALDVVETADLWGRENYYLRIACIDAWISERIRESSLGRKQWNTRLLFDTLEQSREARQWADTPINKPLTIERLLWRISSLAPGNAQRK